MKLFSIITPIYKTPINKILRLYNSLAEQTYSNWEWIVFDDSPTEHTESYNYVDELSKKDKRIHLYKKNKNSGIIGEVKKAAFSLGSGDFLVEVDHDDELVDTCLENLLIAYNHSDEIGFVYGFCCEIFENSDSILDYGNNWSFGYGNYKYSTYKNKRYKVAITPNINSKTIRHIIGIPNHVRSWRKDIYHQIGGHNKNLRVADDYELFVKTFLNTKIAKIDIFTYIQHFEWDTTNTQFNRNAEIQELVFEISKKYNEKIHDRFIELNVDDFAYNDVKYVDNNKVKFEMQNPEIEPYVNIIIPEDILKNNLKEMINKYAYSRVYDIEAILQYRKTDHYLNFIKWLLILTNCQTYLELGVEYSVNIKEMRNLVKMCVGVDINDIQDKENIEFHQMTTDEFFSKNQRTYDIIFIDANHDFEQVRKDFDNSLKFLNKFGIIILHDTDPMTRVLLSKKHCSDAYKVVDYISQFNDLNIITLPIQETGMSLVMRKNDRRINEYSVSDFVEKIEPILPTIEQMHIPEEQMITIKII